MGFIEGLVLILIILKLCGIISIGWLKCFAPFLLYPILAGICLAIFLVMVFIVKLLTFGE